MFKRDDLEIEESFSNGMVTMEVVWKTDRSEISEKVQEQLLQENRKR